MTSLFASQLREIAANSTHELDLKARRNAHAESLLFVRDVAVKQDFETIFAICSDGYQEICALEPAFRTFEHNLFSPQSKDQDREQMSKSENEALDIVIEEFLASVGRLVLLRPAVKTLEWLVRRFKIHVYNVDALLLTLLPYHELSIWKNVLSIIPQDKIVGRWKFLRPYLGTTWSVPRHAVIFAASNNDAFFASLNSYILKGSREGRNYDALIRFWSSIVTEATASRLEQAGSGREEVRRQRTEDVLLKILPVISEGLEITNRDDLCLTCFTIIMILVAKAELNEQVLEKLTQSVSQTLSRSTVHSEQALVTIAILASQQPNRILARSTTANLIKYGDLGANITRMTDTRLAEILKDALVKSIVAHIKTRNSNTWLPALEGLVQNMFLTGGIVSTHTIRPILSKILALNVEKEGENSLRLELIELLRRLTVHESFVGAISQAAEHEAINLGSIEALFETTFLLPEQSKDIMQYEPESPERVQVPTFADLAGEVSRALTEAETIWDPLKQELFNQLSHIFTICQQNARDLQDFLSLPIWKSKSTSNALLVSFLLHYSYGQRTRLQRTTSLRCLKDLIAEHQAECAEHIIIHALVFLSNEDEAVRRCAADMMLTASNNMADNTLYEDEVSQFYGSGSTVPSKKISLRSLRQVLDQGLIPSLEECVLDSQQIKSIMTTILTRDQISTLKKSARNEFFDLLIQHIKAVPLLAFKVDMLLILKSVYKVGSETKSKALLDLLDEWLSFDDQKAERQAQAEHVNIHDVDKAVLTILDVQSRDSLSLIALRLAEGNAKLRPNLAQSLFTLLQELWSRSREDDQAKTADVLFEMSFSSQSVFSHNARETLQNVHLSSNCLAGFIGKSVEVVTQAQSEPPVKRRRRSSHGRISNMSDLNQAATTILSRLTFALELVDNSKPEARPEILAVLFEALSTVHQLRQQRFELPYLANLCLGSIRAIVDHSQATKSSLDLNGIRAELVTDCLRTSDNAQVVNNALLLSASLSTLAPDRIIHHIMPIFTFIDKRTFEKDDDHSVYVMNQAVSQIVPSLVTALQKTKQGQPLLNSIANLFRSFTAAYDHISQPRRVAFYQRLLSCIDTEEHGFIVVAMLAIQNHQHPTFKLFVHNVLAHFPVTVQLSVYGNLILLANDAFSKTPHLAESILGISSSTPIDSVRETVETVLQTAQLVLESRMLKSQILGIYRSDPEALEAFRLKIDKLFRTTLALLRDCKAESDVFAASKKCLNTLLQLVPLREFFVGLPQILNQTDDDMKAYSLRVLAAKIEGHSAKDPKTREAAFRTLEYLTESLTEFIDPSMTQAMLGCIDRIAETYGRKYPEAILSTASVITNVTLDIHNKQNADLEVIHASVLTLTTVVETLREGAVPLVFQALPKLQNILQGCVSDNAGQTAPLFASVCTLLSAIIAHVAFVVSENQLSELLQNIVAVRKSLPAHSMIVDSESDLIRTIGRKIQLDVCIQALKLSDFASNARDGTVPNEALDLLSEAFAHSPKSLVVRNSEAFSDIFLDYLEATAMTGAKEDARDTNNSILDDKLQDLSIKFVYKLSDATFRPIFESWVDWAVDPSDTDNYNEDHLCMRQHALFKLLIKLFSSLKGIFTSYIAYLLKPISRILSEYSDLSTSLSASMRDRSIQVKLDLFQVTLVLLRSATSYDADGFFTAPSHFDPIGIPLVSCLKYPLLKVLRPLIDTHIIPAIVSLASATVDTPAHHHTLSHHITQLRHHDSAQVRLASIKTLHALLDDEQPSLPALTGQAVNEDEPLEGIADEWIANTIGVGSGEGEGARGGGGSAGEVMIYVNEMLEDDNEDVERETRRWVQRVRERVGEDVFEL